MAKKKDKRVTLKIKKKPIMERIGRLFTGPTNIDAEREKLVKNPPHNRPNRLWWDIDNDSTEELLRKLSEDVFYHTGHRRLYKDPETGEDRFIEITKPHYSEIEKYPYTDDPTFKNVMSSEYIIQRNKTRQWIENVLKQNKEQLKLPQSESDYKIRLGLNKVADDLSTKKIKISTSSLPTRVVNVLLQRLSKAGQSGIEAQFLKYKKDLHPEIRKALQLEFPVIKSDTVIPVKLNTGEKMVKGGHVTAPQTPETLNTRLNQGYGDILQKEANRTDPNFKHLSDDAKKEYINFMHRQLMDLRPMNLKYVELEKIESGTGKNIPFTEKLIKDYTDSRQIYFRRLIQNQLTEEQAKEAMEVPEHVEVKRNIISKQQAALNSGSASVNDQKKNIRLKRAIKIIEKKHQKEITREKAAGKLGTKMLQIMKGFKKPPRGK